MKISSKFLVSLINQAPLFLLIAMILSFVILFVIELFYYSEVIFANNLPHPFNWVMGAFIGLMFQLARLAFGIAGASDFAQNKTSRGVTGMIFSVALAIVASYEITEVVTFWSNGNQALFRSANLAIQTIVWLGLIIEVRLALTVGGTMTNEQGLQQKPKQGLQHQDKQHQDESDTASVMDDLPPMSVNYSSAKQMSV